MSFILDALRKSDTDRQRQTAPGIADTRYYIMRKKRSIWLPVLAVILTVNVLIMGLLLFADPSYTDCLNLPGLRATLRPTDAGPAHPADSDRAIVMAPVQIPVSNPEPEPESIPPAPVRSPETIAAAEEPHVAITEDQPAAQSAFKSESAVVRPRPEPVILPSMQQLTVSGQLSVAPLHVDIHVYPGEQSKRFVFINMRKYREGQRLDEGPVLEEITNTGVILSHQGNRFTLERD